MAMPPRVLIIAYGNPLRCDDGIAWHAAEVLADKFPAQEVEILRLHQLAPEVADAVRQHELVLFVDAACIDDFENTYPGEIRVRDLAVGQLVQHTPGHFSHVYSPAQVLDLVRDLYHATPKAFAVTVAGENFGHGADFSPAVSAAIPALVATIERLILEAHSTSATTKDAK
jgi:hydrogenase maturation protease